MMLPDESRPLARLVLFTFLLTFVAARVLVYCIMARDIPDLFLHVGGTHVHHLNYGIVLLCVVGAYLLFWRPTGRRLRVAAIAYAIGLALTFDEFGMWLHLGGGYWQRASFDAVTVIAAALALLAYGPPVRKIWPRHALSASVAIVIVAVFFWLWSRAWLHAAQPIGTFFKQLEEQGPR